MQLISNWVGNIAAATALQAWALNAAYAERTAIGGPGNGRKG